MKKKSYKAVVSSDWSECLAPCGPFDAIVFNHPHLADDLEDVFRSYTGNRVTLGQASRKIEALLPEPLTVEKMDAYLHAEFSTYTGVPDLIEWCRSRDILFMINTTAMIGYFQRVFDKRLLPPVDVLSANPMIRYPCSTTDPGHVLELFETPDKGRNTAAVARSFGVPFHKVIVIGDSGGDGPHFEWAAKAGARLIGSMTKFSLAAYCNDKHVAIDHQFGRAYAAGEKPDRSSEMTVDFIDLTTVIGELLHR